MKNCLFFYIFCYANLVCAQNIPILSDYDDTLKIANVSGSRWEIVRRSFFTEDFYAGMPELFYGWKETGFAEFTVLSGSPQQFQKKIEEDLYENALFPKLELILRDWFRERDLYSYKLFHMYRLKLPNVILIGDDTQKDPEIYQEYSQNRPVLTSYIRKVKGRPISNLQLPFVSAFDVAVNEFLEGRINFEGAVQVGEAILKAKDKVVFPKFISCDLRMTACLDLELEWTLKRYCEAIQQKIDSICLDRLNQMSYN